MGFFMKQTGRMIVCGLAVLGAATVCGCQSSVNTVSEEETYAEAHVVKDRRFVTDPFLRNRLLLKEVSTSETSAGFLQVQVSALNDRTGFFSGIWSSLTGGNPYRISYKFVWLDGRGMAVSDGVWMTRLVKPGETVYFLSVAPTRQCRDFILNIKEAEEE